MKKVATIIAAALFCSAAFAGDWAPAGDNIRTRWAADVNPSNVLPEYPRPQMERKDWQNLNGLWKYAITPADASSMGEAEGDILVPFAIESSLSGVGRTVADSCALWYHRTFTVPSSWKNMKVLLNFGAVDWSCEVSVNGKKAGSHKGGYGAFSMDITKYLKGKGANELTVKVLDATDKSGFQPRGKQVSNPHGIWYTSVTGIWQTVWIEAVNKTAYISDFSVESDIAKGTFTVSPRITGKADEVIVDVEFPGGSAKTMKVKAGESAVIKVSDPRLWTPDHPDLYDISITLKKSGNVLDKVKGYAAMRSISKVKDANNHLRMALNGEPLFQFGPLDQGWWPDGLYTAPTEEAMKYDIEKTKEMGFNMIRKHVKVEPARWYYLCDKLGMLVWQDMPSTAGHKQGGNIWSQNVKDEGGNNYYNSGSDANIPDEWKKNFKNEWKEIISQHKCFPCIVVWVPFNEAWGQFDTKAIAAFTAEQDPTRLVNVASGGNWESGKVGDILDSHFYHDEPRLRIWDPALVNVLGEYGGYGLALEGHLWQKDKNWGYIQYKNGEEVSDAYVKSAEALIPEVEAGCSAAVYTQTTDVEGEVNGLMTYDREVVKVNILRVAAANRAVIRAMKN